MVSVPCSTTVACTIWVLTASLYLACCKAGYCFSSISSSATVSAAAATVMRWVPVISVSCPKNNTSISKELHCGKDEFGSCYSQHSYQRITDTGLRQLNST